MPLRQWTPEDGEPVESQGHLRPWTPEDGEPIDAEPVQLLPGGYYPEPPVQKEFAKYTRPPMETWGETARNLFPRMKAQMANIWHGMLARDLAQLEQPGVPRLGPDVRGKTEEEAQALAREATDRQLALARTAQEELAYMGRNRQTATQRAVSNVAQATPQMLAALGVGIGTRNPYLAALTMHPTTAGASFGEYANYYADENTARSIEQRARDMSRAEWHAERQGLIEAGTELLPFKALFKPGSTLMGRLISTLLHDLAGESVATVTQKIDDVLARSPEGATVEEVLTGLQQGINELPDTWYATLLQTGLMTVPVQASGAGRRQPPAAPPPAQPPPTPTPADVPGGLATPEAMAAGITEMEAPPPPVPPPAAPPPPAEAPIGDELVGAPPIPPAVPSPVEPAAEAPTPYIQRDVVRPSETPYIKEAEGRPYPDLGPDGRIAAPQVATAPPTGARGIESPVREGEVRGGSAATQPPAAVLERPPVPPPASPTVEAPAAPITPESQTVTPTPKGAVVVDDRRPFAEQGLTRDQFMERYGPEGVNASVANDPAMAYRSMSEEEYNATVAAGRGVVSDGRWRAPGERSNFGEDFSTALHYQVGNRTDPRVTGKPVYVAEAPRTSLAPSKVDRGNFEGETADVRRVWRVEASGEQLSATLVTPPTAAPAEVESAPDVEQAETVPEREAIDVPPRPSAEDRRDTRQVQPTPAPTETPEAPLAPEAEPRAAKQGPAGKAYVPMFGYGKEPPTDAQRIALGQGERARTLEKPEKPIRRKQVMNLFQRVFNIKVYEGKPFKGKKGWLGFYRPGIGEIRIRAHNELQVTAHEVWHWIDNNFPSITALYNEPQFEDELRSISYDANLLHEGFAEFGRLFMTQEVEAVQRVPRFYEAFIREAHKLGILDKIEQVQDLMHQWYGQGALARAQSKIGGEATRLQRFVEFFGEGFWKRLTAETLDWLHAAKIVEREVTGKIAEDAVDSAYKSMRLLAGTRSTVDSVINYGTIAWSARKDLHFNGKGLRQVLEPVGDVLDTALEYFLGRRLAELRDLKKPTGFSNDEIEALLDSGRKSPKFKEIKEAFAELQRFKDRVLDFAVQSNLLSQRTVDEWRELYQNHVPMHRVAEEAGTLAHDITGRGTVQPFARYKGSTRNVRDILDNLTMNTAMIIEASLRNSAKLQLYGTIRGSIKGARFAVQVPPDTERRAFSIQKLQDILRVLARNAQGKGLAEISVLADLLRKKNLAEVQDQAVVFFGGQQPHAPGIDSVLKDGKPVYFQVADPLLWKMVQEVNYHKPLNLAFRILGMGRRFITATVTRFPDFWFPNWMRDVVTGFTQSKGGQRFAIDALQALNDIVTESEHFRLFVANGGGYGMNIRSESARLRLHLNKVMADNNLTLQDVIDTPAKLTEFWNKWGQAAELATRLAEFKKIRNLGGSLREAAFQGREVSTDFAMRGRSMAMRTVTTLSPFLNARIESLYRLGRELGERGPGHKARVMKFSARALMSSTFPSLLIYLIFNRGDEDYEDLPIDTRALYNVVPSPDGDGVYLWPRAFETGMFFGYLPILLWEAYEKKEGKEVMDGVAFMLTNTFALDPTPGLIEGYVRAYVINRHWNGMPVVPESMENLEDFLQAQPYTPEMYRRLGKALNMSPLRLEEITTSYFNNVAFYVAFFSDAMLAPSSGGERPDTPLSRWPVLRRFFRRAPYTRTQSESDFYDALERVTTVVASVRRLENDLRGDDLADYLGEGREQILAMESVVGEDSEEAQQIGADIRAINNDPTMSGEEKLKQIDKLEADRMMLFREAMKDIDLDDLEKISNALEGMPSQ